MFQRFISARLNSLSGDQLEDRELAGYLDGSDLDNRPLAEENRSFAAGSQAEGHFMEGSAAPHGGKGVSAQACVHHE